MDTVRDSVTKKVPGNKDLSLSMKELLGGSYPLSDGSGSCDGERGSVLIVLAEWGQLLRVHTAGAGEGMTQDTQHGVPVRWDKVHPFQKVQEYLLERKYSTSANGTGSLQIFFKRRVVTFLAMSESPKHFLSINRGVTVEHTTTEDSLLQFGAVYLASIMN